MKKIIPTSEKIKARLQEEITVYCYSGMGGGGGLFSAFGEDPKSLLQKYGRTEKEISQAIPVVTVRDDVFRFQDGRSIKCLGKRTKVSMEGFLE